MVTEWSRAPANSSREEGDMGSRPSPAKISFSDEFFLNNSRVHGSVEVTVYLLVAASLDVYGLRLTGL